jgi:putative membrane-bound dehydrogenase-like protein
MEWREKKIQKAMGRLESPGTHRDDVSRRTALANGSETAHFLTLAATVFRAAATKNEILFAFSTSFVLLCDHHMKPLALFVALHLVGSCSVLAAGKQLTGQHAPTMTPALTPAEAQKKFVVPKGFEVRLFAAEPDVVNPVAMTWDERGRLWVLELYEYPLGAPPGQKGRDRIKILEDTDNDGRADKVTVFADGLNLATGLALGNGGVYVGQAPDLLFLQDTNHDDRADTRKVLLTGFGLEDRHELLNGFTWGPDGWLYLTHGIFTHSKVKIPEASEPGVEVTAAVARYHPRTKKFEVFAEGTSNPWGVDFDAAGNAFVSACVIDHLFHVAPGGSYQRQAGVPSNPYTYEILPSIVEHKHHMAAYCGICIYQGDQFPAEYQGRVFMGNIHQNAINHDRLIPNGASFRAVAENDFLTTSDGWFRPISEQVGPDGALWIGDWCDKYPCYQNARADPEGVDREHGRIWRVVYVGKEAGKKVPPRPDVKMDFSQLAGTNLLALFDHPNVWQRRMAQQALRDCISRTRRRNSGNRPQDEPGFTLALVNTLDGKKSIQARIAAFWLIEEFEIGIPSWVIWSPGTVHADEWLRRCMAAWRVANQGDESSPEGCADLETLANDSDPRVQFAVATAVRRIVSSRLVTDYEINDTAPVGKALANLIKSAATAKDPLVNYMIWLAGEPLLAKNPEPGLKWLVENGAATMPLSGILIRKAMHRLCDTGMVTDMNHAVAFLSAIGTKDAGFTLAALDGLIEGQQAKPLRPTLDTTAVISKLKDSGNAQLQERARQLGTLWGDAGAVQQTLATINDAQASIAERTKAIQSARQLKTDAARDALLTLIARDNPEPLAVEAIRALGVMDDENIGGILVAGWKRFTPTEQAAAADVLMSRRHGFLALLSAIESKEISASELSASAIQQLGQIKDDSIRQRAAQAIGRIRPANADKQKIIAEKKEIILRGGPPDLQAGHALAQKTCFVCHKLHGEGADVGPDLTGVGRASLDALLANVIDPNQIVGRGYESVEVETTDGRTLAGRLVEDTASQVKLLAAGPKVEVIARSDIQRLRVSELSVMPEGLEQMPDADFRNLIGYILNASPPVLPKAR